MSGREAWKRDKKALANAQTLCNRQRRNMKAYVAIIKNTKEAMENNNLVRALALVSGNFKYPPDMLKGLDCDHEFKYHSVMKCEICGVYEDD